MLFYRVHPTSLSANRRKIKYIFFGGGGGGGAHLGVLGPVA